MQSMWSFLWLSKVFKCKEWLNTATNIVKNSTHAICGKHQSFLAHVMLCLMVTCPAYAQQTYFNKTSSGLNTNFSYTFKHLDAEYSIAFAIETATLYAMPPSPATYNKKVFQENVYVRVLETARGIDPKTANINVRKSHSGLSFSVSSRVPNKAQNVLDTLTLAHQQAQDNYWADHYFVKYASPTGASGIRHDHAKYTRNSTASLVPVVEAIKDLQNNPYDPREFVTIALGWIQSIPYNRLEDRLSSNGAGFISPRDLLLQNQGDCDSKSTLMAALLSAYNKNINVQMVYLPEHALLAVDMPNFDDEMTLQYQNKDYVLLEPTGPAQLAIGEVADTTKRLLRNRQFDLASMSF